MAIVTLQIPLAISKISYGRAILQPDKDGALRVPGYVAKTMLTLQGVTGPALPDSVSALLAATAEDFEANYLFWAFGQPLPDNDKISAASALMTANGEPAVSAS